MADPKWTAPDSSCVCGKAECAECMTPVAQVPRGEIVEQLECAIGGRQHVEANEQKLRESLAVFLEESGRSAAPWTEDDAAAWRAYKAKYGLRSTAVPTEGGGCACVICGAPLNMVRYVNGVVSIEPAIGGAGPL